MSDALHFASPLRFNAKGRVVKVVQDTPQEISSCVFNIASCIQGTREDSPEFGIPDLTFSVVPLDLDRLQRAIERWEPRADLLLTEQEEAMNAGLRRITIEE